MRARTEGGFRVRSAYLVMVGAKHDPATETVSQVNHGGAAAEADHVGEGCSQGQDEDLAQHHDMEMAWD